MQCSIDASRGITDDDEKKTTARGCADWLHPLRPNQMECQHRQLDEARRQQEHKQSTSVSLTCNHAAAWGIRSDQDADIRQTAIMTSVKPSKGRRLQAGHARGYGPASTKTVYDTTMALNAECILLQTRIIRSLCLLQFLNSVAAETAAVHLKVIGCAV